MGTLSHAGHARNATRRGTSARRTTDTTFQPAVLDAKALHAYGTPRDARVRGATLTELQLLALVGHELAGDDGSYLTPLAKGAQ